MEKIKEILRDIHPEFDYEDSNDFIEDGYLDSFDIITLVTELEQEYDITIDGLDVIPENFSSYESINELIKKSSHRK